MLTTDPPPTFAPQAVVSNPANDAPTRQLLEARVSSHDRARVRRMTDEFRQKVERG